MTSVFILLGRILLSSLFLFSAYWHITNWDAALAKTAATGYGRPEIIMTVATALLGLGGLSVLLGYNTRIGAILLIVELLGTAILFHPFWTLSGSEMQLSFLGFLNRISLCGGLLILLGCGPGSISIDLKKGKAW
jgi:putative oxidoreductase